MGKKDKKCPECGNMALFLTIYGWWKCRRCFYSGNPDFIVVSKELGEEP